MTWMSDVLNNIATNVVGQVWTLAGWSFGQILVFLIAIGLLFTVVNYFRRK